MERVIYYTLFVLVIFLLIFSVFSYYKSSRYGQDFTKALDAQNPEDKCATPQGYTDEEWKEHMGHHPDIYKECL